MMNLLPYRWTAVSVLILGLSACSQEKGAELTATQAAEKPAVLFEAQRDALEAAKQTEAIIQQAADERMKQSEP